MGQDSQKTEKELLKRKESWSMTGRLLALKQTWDLLAAGLQRQLCQQELKSVPGEMPKRWCFGQWVNRGCQLPNPLSDSTAKWIAREINQRKGNSLRKKKEDLMHLNYCRKIVQKQRCEEGLLEESLLIACSLNVVNCGSTL